VIGELPSLTLRIMLGSGDQFLIRVTSIIVVITLVIAGSNHDSLWSLLRPHLVTSSTPPCTLVDCLGWHPPTTARGHLGAILHENSPDRLLARGMPGGDVEGFFCGIWLVTAELM
jgi:hypothetical protein